VSRVFCIVPALLLAVLPARPAALAVVNAASYSALLAPDAAATAFGADLAASGAATTVTVQDGAGTVRSAIVLYAYPQQAAFVVPAGTAAGQATVTVTSGDGTVSSAVVQISPVAPGLFAANANGQGVAAAIAAVGTRAVPVFTCGAAPLSCAAVPVNANQAVLELFGTGIRGDPAGVTCTIGGISVPVLFAGAQGQYPGLDQVNVALPANPPAQEPVNIVLTVDGQVSNTVTLDTSGADFYVSPKGNDLWSGTLALPNAAGTDGPFASVAKAQLALRSLLKTAPARPLTMMMRGGTYYLPLSLTSPGTLAFSAGDSGSASTPVTWENYPGETPIVSGGEPVGAGGLGLTWTQASGNLWQVTLPAATRPFEYLFYNGQRRLRARVQSANGVGYYMNGRTCYDTTTNQAVNTSQCDLGTFLRIAAVVPPTGANAGCPSATGTAAQGSKCLDRFTYNPSDPIANWVNLNASTSPCGGSPNPYPTGDIELDLFESWTMEVMRISCVDTTNHIIYFTGKTQGGASNGPADTFNSFGPVAGHRYMVENARDAFDAARAAGQTGIWFLDRSTTPWTLNYLANSGENPNSDSVVIAQAGAAASTGGSLLAAANLSYVTFRGLTWEVDNFVPPPAGFASDTNAETTLPEAIDCDSCQQVTFDGVTVRHTSASGILIASASGVSGPPASGDVIENSAFYDLGDSGIRIGHAPAANDNPAVVVQNIMVQNNLVQGYSRVFADGEGIAQGNGHDITYLHNDVTDGYHAGLSVCSVACAPYAANGYNIVSQYNHIWNVIQGITSDGGTLYYNTGGTQGAGTGNKILNNLIHDTTDSSIIDIIGGVKVAGSAYGGEGIYLDNLSAGVDVENNVVYRVAADAALMSTGPGAGQPANTFNNNIFAFGRTAMYKENLPWAETGCDSPSLRVNFTNNIVYFDKDDSSSFYPIQGCAWSCGLNYNLFQNFQGNLYWRTDGKFASYNKGFHVLGKAPSDPTTCSGGATPASWTFLTFSQWQGGAPPGGVPPAMHEDATGAVTVNPGFGNSGQPVDYLLTANPIAGFDFTRTNDTVLHAGRSNPVIPVPTVPATFPTYHFTDF